MKKQLDCTRRVKAAASIKATKWRERALTTNFPRAHNPNQISGAAMLWINFELKATCGQFGHCPVLTSRGGRFVMGMSKKAQNERPDDIEVTDEAAPDNDKEAFLACLAEIEKTLASVHRSREEFDQLKSATNDVIANISQPDYVEDPSQLCAERPDDREGP
jgi:hypothetical protein